MAITSIQHKGLKELFTTGKSHKVNPHWWRSALLILDHLDSITSLADCAGVKDCHPLKGSRKNEYAMHVNGNWCITFTFDGHNVDVLDLEDYH